MNQASMSEDLRYPVGKWDQEPVPAAGVAAAIDTLAALPGRARAAVAGLDERQLDTPYREGGWTVRQVIHHLADSHANAFLRTKWTLTEETPTIKTYDEAGWAELADGRSLPVEVSLQLLDALHTRWVTLLRSLGPAALDRTFRHPEYPDRPLTLRHLLSLYDWHCRHHVAHVTRLREREGW
jgi:hypothetical protein